MASCTSSKAPGKDGKGIASGTLRYLHDRRSEKTYVAPGSHTTALEGVLNPDFLALGLGGTNLMAMLWAVAMGKRAVGVEMRGDPSLGVHWNVREDLFHQFGLIDQLMLNRYDEADMPRRDNGKIFSLADCFFSASTKSGDVVPDEVIDGYDAEQHIAGTIVHVEYIDDRYKDGVPSRTVTKLPPPAPPVVPEPLKIRGNMQDVLDGPSTFQASALAVQLLLRRYLEKIEEMDLEAGKYPRVRLFTQHRAVEKDGFGFIRHEDGRLQVRIEEVTEMDFKGQTVRLRTPGSDIIDIGVPELFSIAQGAHSSDAKRLGFEQKDVEADHNDGRGPIVAQADYIAGQFELLVDGRLRRRIASDFDADGNEYWIRQIAVGHENDPEVAWVLVQVPDHMTFDPIEAGLVASNTCTSSLEYFASYQILLQDFYEEQAALVLGMPVHALKKVERLYGPKIFSLVERMGDDARIAPNGVVAGDSFGNGHFLTSAGAMTGMVGHSFRFLEHWQRRAEGVDMDSSVRLLADRIKQDTQAWLTVSAKEFTEAIPINFGAERGAQISSASGIDPAKRAHNVAEARTYRHGLLPLDPSDWRRLFLKNGRVLSSPLPAIHPDHPNLAAWRELNPGKSVAQLAEISNPEDIMMGATPMKATSSVMEEKIAQVKLEHHAQVDQSWNKRPSIGPYPSAPRSSYGGSTSSGSSSIASHSTTSGAKKRAQQVERLNRKTELSRHREELYRQIEAISRDMPATPDFEDAPVYPAPPAAPAALVAKLLVHHDRPATPQAPVTSSYPTARPSMESRRASDVRSIASSVSSSSSGGTRPPLLSRGWSALSDSSTSTAASSPRVLSPGNSERKPSLTSMPEGSEEDDQWELQKQRLQTVFKAGKDQSFSGFMGAMMDMYQKQFSGGTA